MKLQLKKLNVKKEAVELNLKQPQMEKIEIESLSYDEKLKIAKYIYKNDMRCCYGSWNEFAKRNSIYYALKNADCRNRDDVKSVIKK